MTHRTGGFFRWAADAVRLCSGWRVLLRVVVRLTQLIKLLYERNNGRTTSMCVMKSGMSRKTASKYLRQENVLEPRQTPHTWRTRTNPLAAIWPKALVMLGDAPEL